MNSHTPFLDVNSFISEENPYVIENETSTPPRSQQTAQTFKVSLIKRQRWPS
jgi:hypothetical protein